MERWEHKEQIPDYDVEQLRASHFLAGEYKLSELMDELLMLRHLKRRIEKFGITTTVTEFAYHHMKCDMERFEEFTWRRNAIAIVEKMLEKSVFTTEFVNPKNQYEVRYNSHVYVVKPQ